MRLRTCLVVTAFLVAVCWTSSASAGLVVVGSSEVWNGTANPHAGDGVTLFSEGGTMVYGIPDGMTLNAGGSIALYGGGGGTPNVTFRFAPGGGNLHFADAAAFIDVYEGTRDGSAQLFSLEMGNNDITAVAGGGIIQRRTSESGRDQMSVRITSGLGGDVTLNSINLGHGDSQPTTVTVLAGGTVSLGVIDTRDTAGGGNSGGNVTIRGSQVTVDSIFTGSGRTASQAADGDVAIYALSTFDLSNRLRVTGQIDTEETGTQQHTGGNVLLAGVQVELGPGFINTQTDTNNAVTILAGTPQYGKTAGDLFQNNSGGPFTAAHVVPWNDRDLPRVLEQQTFDSAASAAAAGWTGSGNTANGHNFGFSATDNTGGVSRAGEAGGVMPRVLPFAYYADTKLAGDGTLNRNDTIMASGEFDVTQINNFDGGFRIGHFNQNGGPPWPDSLGVVVSESGPNAVRVGAQITFADGTFLNGTPLVLTGAIGTDRQWAYFFDPTGGVEGKGRLTVMIDGPGGGLSVADLTSAFDGKNLDLNAFGLWNGTIPTQPNNWVTAFIDNVLYTNPVPEPSTLLLAGLGGIGLVLFRRRRR